MYGFTILSFKSISLYNNKLSVLYVDEKPLLYMIVLVKLSGAEK